MKVATILGTRPEIIRLSLVIGKLDALAERHILLHTGQNYDPGLSSRFFTELEVREPDIVLNHRRQSIGGQMSVMFAAAERMLARERPDKVLVLGDTNSALCAIVAERMGIPVVHMEAGNRCFDRAVPEEKNRMVIDAVSTFNLPYTENSKGNLLREGFPVHRIFRCGNPIREVMLHYDRQIFESNVLQRLGLEPGDYMLATIHRAENVDHPATLASIMRGLRLAAEKQGVRVVCSLHPRTRSRLSSLEMDELQPHVSFHEPFGFFDFVKLEQHARCVLTDSGTVQEECCLLGVPTVTVRTTTERPETVDCGSNIVAGVTAERIRDAVQAMTALPARWKWPEGYEDEHVSDKVAKFIVGGTGDV